MRMLYGLPLLLSLLLMFGCSHTGPGGPRQADHDRPLTGEIDISHTWQGDYPVGQLDRLPEGQREQKTGYIDGSDVFEDVWSALMPGSALPRVDFSTHLVVFVRNIQFYNRLKIAKVYVSDGVAQVIAMETMSARPIQDTVGMSLAVVARKGINGIQSGQSIISVTNKP